MNKSDVTLQNAPKIVKETATTSFSVDVTHSNLKWMAAFKFMPGEHNGNIKMKEGNLIVNGDEIIGGTLIINMKAITSNDLSDLTENAKLISHLKNPSIFYTDSFAEARFDISNVSYTKDETKRAQQCTISGDLSIKGIQSPITFPAEIENVNDKIKITANLKIDGKKWNLHETNTPTFSNQAITKETEVDLELQWRIIANKTF